MIFRVLHYNPLSAKSAQTRRNIAGYTEISRLLVWWPHNEGLLLGWKLAHRDSSDAQLWRQGGHAHRSATNRHWYSLLCVNPFTTQHIHQTWTPPPSLQGRAIAARLKGGFFDLFVCCMYLPPRPQTASKRGRYRRTVEALLEWLDERLSEQKHRTTPIVLMDANDGIGLELRAGRYRLVETQCIAAAGSRREHAAGKRLREIMEKHHMRGHVSGNGRPDVVWQRGTGLTHRLCFGLLLRFRSDALARSVGWRRSCSSSGRAN